jgi:hypothetical protein
LANKNYINNTEFLEKLAKYQKSKKKAIKNNEPIPPIPDDIGICILDIARGLARRPNFSAYTFKEEMISDGIENCFQYLDNFDPKISKNPFSYFTQIVYYAFLRRIQSESKQTYVKFKAFENHELYTNHKHETKKHVNLINSIVNEKTQDIIIKFEERMAAKSVKKPILEIEDLNLESFME